MNIKIPMCEACTPPRCKKNAFTLIELLISVSIIAILIAIGIASYATVNKQSRDTKRKSDLEQLRSALEMYRADNGSYPDVSNTDFVVANGNLDSALVTNDYLPAIPTDPLPSTYNYYYQATDKDQTGKYYGYCVCAHLETNNALDSQCQNAIPYTQGDPGHSACTYGRRNP